MHLQLVYIAQTTAKRKACRASYGASASQQPMHDDSCDLQGVHLAMACQWPLSPKTKHAVPAMHTKQQATFEDPGTSDYQYWRMKTANIPVQPKPLTVSPAATTATATALPCIINTHACSIQHIQLHRKTYQPNNMQRSLHSRKMCIAAQHNDGRTSHHLCSTLQDKNSCRPSSHNFLQLAGSSCSRAHY